MATSEQFSSLFSHDETETDYEEEKRKKKQRLVRNEFEKSEREIERQCNKISQIFDYINQPHTEPWEATECSATAQERELPPFSLDPEFIQYREEKRENN